MAITDIELVCLGQPSLIKACCQVTWYEVLQNEEFKRAAIITHFLPFKRVRREKRVNYITFSCIDGQLYHYNRYVCIKPRTYEEKWFKIIDGQFAIVGRGEGNQPETQLLELINAPFRDKPFSIWGGGDRERALQFLKAGDVIAPGTQVYEMRIRLG